MDSKFTILLGLYKGEGQIAEQLKSIAEQDYTNWHLIVSSDEDESASTSIVREFASGFPDGQVQIVEGPRKGFARNFVSMLERVPPDSDFVAFSDQDDFWLPNKLTAAIDQLSSVDGAAMVCGRTIIADEALVKTGLSPLFKKPPHFANALVQNIGGGNTMAFNRKALDMLLKAQPFADNIVAHDWWCYQVLTGMGARVIYDPVPHILYRQHGENLIGSNSSFGARLTRFNMLLKGRFRDWSDRTVASLSPLRAELTPENQQILEQFEKARTSYLIRRIYLFRKSRIYRQTRLSGIGLWAAIMLCLI